MYSGPEQGTEGPGEGPGHVSAARAGALSVAGILGRMLHIICYSIPHSSSLASLIRCNIYIQHESIYPFCEYHGEKSILHIYHQKC